MFQEMTGTSLKKFGLNIIGAKNRWYTNMVSEKPTKNLFDYYEQKENNFTKALINTLENAFDNDDKIVISTFLSLLKSELTYSSDMEFRLLSGMEGGTYDAAISSEKKSYYLAIETKIKEGALDIEQLRRHCKDLEHKDFKIKLLLTITPDLENGRIEELSSIKCDNYHLNWKKIYESFNDVRNQETSEVTSFLINQFNDFLDTQLLNTNIAGGITKATPEGWNEELEEDWRNGTEEFYQMNGYFLRLIGKVMVIYKTETKEIIGEARIESIEKNEDPDTFGDWGNYNYFFSKTGVRYPKSVQRNKIEKKVENLQNFFSGRTNFQYITNDDLRIIRNEAGYQSDI